MKTKPLFMRIKDVANWYGVDIRRAEELTQGLEEVGIYGAEKLYSSRDIDKKIKKESK